MSHRVFSPILAIVLLLGGIQARAQDEVVLRQPAASDLQPLLGRQVRSKNGENIGRIVNVLADASGRVRAAVIDFGGFMGVGSRMIAVDLTTLRRVDSKSETALVLDLSREEVKQNPEYREDNPIVFGLKPPPTMIQPPPLACVPPKPVHHVRRRIVHRKPKRRPPEPGCPAPSAASVPAVSPPPVVPPDAPSPPPMVAPTPPSAE